MFFKYILNSDIRNTTTVDGNKYRDPYSHNLPIYTHTHKHKGSMETCSLNKMSPSNPALQELKEPHGRGGEENA